MNEKILNLLRSRRAGKRTTRVLHACAEACVCERTLLSDTYIYALSSKIASTL